MPTYPAAALTAQGLRVGDLSAVSFEVSPGQILALSGPSGSGKSRLLRALADLDPHEGTVRLDQMQQSSTPGHVWRQAVMMVPADSQWWADTVGEHFPAGAADDLDALGFGPEVMGWQVGRLSSGEKQRLALLRAIAHQPRALLLDEPTANLDPDTTAIVETWLTGLARRHSWPVLWVAHDPAQIKRVADTHLRIASKALAAVPCN
ncbi:MAG: ATP-binding cassette domain-containing protein [Zoogloeaceae bacterium]|uniref:ABC transporter ATP-binding protein n=1 Tax=Denitromonas sp. TaxID=2734609 RepID=UPI001DB23F1B|nr:ATP-binding cassette domain-containing protein [Rhodocyclaceae bacterium]MCP5222899.1 ATP-binding cassette domain-containing protein [Zoogloeaceae bacterium]HPR07203.1 ATP-binding cassette domain-containing protein [Denitromonas sp.]